MDQHLVFAISREYGSGGREIGERLASELGIAYYDKLLLKRIAEESGLSGLTPLVRIIMESVEYSVRIGRV